MRLWGWWIIIDDNKRILLLKRSNYTQKYPWYWGIPWWRWKPWELPEEIAVREVKEESWLNFIPTKLYHNSIMKRKSWDVLWNRFIGTYSWQINVQIEEVDWYAWYTYEEALNLKLSFDYRELVKLLHSDWLL